MACGCAGAAHRLGALVAVHEGVADEQQAQRGAGRGVPEARAQALHEPQPRPLRLPQRLLPVRVRPVPQRQEEHEAAQQRRQRHHRRQVQALLQRRARAVVLLRPRAAVGARGRRWRGAASGCRPAAGWVRLGSGYASTYSRRPAVASGGDQRTCTANATAPMCSSGRRHTLQSQDERCLPSSSSA